jgi:hypothetical protein
VAAKRFAFISYAHENARIVLAVANRVVKEGYEIWCDRAIKVSSTWTDEIAKAISECEIFVVFLSKASAVSLFVRSEIEYAFQKQKRIIPVYLDPIEELPPGLAIGLNAVQGIAGTGSAAIAQKLCAALKQNNLPNASKSFAKKAIIAILIALIGAGSIAIFYARDKDALLKQVATQLGALNQAEREHVKTLSLAKSQYAPAEPIAIKIDKAIKDKLKNGAIAGVANVGADDLEWITVKQVAKPAASIIVRAPGLAGEYEARIYALNGELIAAKQFSALESAQSGYAINTSKNAYAPNEKFSAKIGDVKKDAIDSRMVVGVWRVWASGDDAVSKRIVDKKNAAIALFAPRSNGRYEIRVYNNVDILTKATLMAKKQISVRGLNDAKGAK